MKINLEDEEVIELPIIPMIDCAFLLLVFFLIATTLKQPEKLVNQATVYHVSLPQASAPQTIPLQGTRKILVTAKDIVARGVDDKHTDRYVSLNQLVQDLDLYRQACAKLNKEPVVVLEGDKQAQYERIIQVWNAIRTAGIRQVFFAVQPQ